MANEDAPHTACCPLAAEVDRCHPGIPGPRPEQEEALHCRLVESADRCLTARFDLAGQQARAMKQRREMRHYRNGSVWVAWGCGPLPRFAHRRNTGRLASEDLQPKVAEEERASIDQPYPAEMYVARFAAHGGGRRDWKEKEHAVSFEHGLSA